MKVIHSFFTLIGLCIFSVTLHPTAVFAASWQWTTPTPMQANFSEQDEVLVPADTIVLNEIAPKNTGQGEYVELYNYGNTDVLLKGWVLQDASGSKMILGDVKITAQGYFFVKPSFSLNDDGDQVILLNPLGEIRDELRYEKNELQEGSTLGRFCDVYELLFCSVEATSPTPGAVNKRLQLEVSADKENGSYPYGTLISLAASDPKAKIFYTFSASAAASDEFHLYRGPFELTDTLSIYYYALTEGKSSELTEAHFTVQSLAKGRKNYGVHISELYTATGSTLGGKSWIELSSRARTSYAMKGWVLTSDVRGVCEGGACLRFADKESLAPSAMKAFDVSEQLFTKGVLYLFDQDKYIVDEIHFSQTSMSGKSYVRKPSPYRVLTTPLQNMVLVASDIPTKGKENIMVTIPSKKQDQDGDMLTSKEEKNYGTSTTKFDSNSNEMPDYFDHGESMNVQDMFFYKKLLTDLLYLVEEKDQIAFRTLPFHKVHFMKSEGEKLHTVEADEQGYGSFSYEGEGKVTLFLQVEDPSGMISFAGEKVILDSTRQKIAEGALQIVRVLANPEGTDTKEHEWIELANVSDTSVDLTRITLVITDKTIRLDGSPIAPGAKRILTAKELGITLPNSAFHITLASLTGDTISSIDVPETQQGQIFDVQLPVNTNAVKSTNVTKSTSKKVVATSKKSSSLSYARHAPALAEVAVNEEEMLPVDYAPMTPVLMSEANAPEQASQSQANTVLALLGGFMSSLAGALFWKF